jgi:hypothetical protein
MHDCPWLPEVSWRVRPASLVRDAPRRATPELTPTPARTDKRDIVINGEAEPDVRTEAPARPEPRDFVAMTAFHLLAVAAFFYIDLGAILAAIILYFVAGMFGIGMAITGC